MRRRRLGEVVAPDGPSIGVTLAPPGPLPPVSAWIWSSTATPTSSTPELRGRSPDRSHRRPGRGRRIEVVTIETNDRRAVPAWVPTPRTRGPGRLLAPHRHDRVASRSHVRPGWHRPPRRELTVTGRLAPPRLRGSKSGDLGRRPTSVASVPRAPCATSRRECALTNPFGHEPGRGHANDDHQARGSANPGPSISPSSELECLGFQYVEFEFVDDATVIADDSVAPHPLHRTPPVEGLLGVLTRGPQAS